MIMSFHGINVADSLDKKKYDIKIIKEEDRYEHIRLYIIEKDGEPIDDIIINDNVYDRILLSLEIDQLMKNDNLKRYIEVKNKDDYRISLIRNPRGTNYFLLIYLYPLCVLSFKIDDINGLHDLISI